VLGGLSQRTSETTAITILTLLTKISVAICAKAPAYDTGVGRLDASHDSVNEEMINGKILLSLKPVVRTRRSYNRAGLLKQQKSF
jgi:hypothetical protein